MIRPTDSILHCEFAPLIFIRPWLGVFFLKAFFWGVRTCALGVANLKAAVDEATGTLSTRRWTLFIAPSWVKLSQAKSFSFSFWVKS